MKTQRSSIAYCALTGSGKKNIMQYSHLQKLRYGIKDMEGRKESVNEERRNKVQNKK